MLTNTAFLLVPWITMQDHDDGKRLENHVQRELGLLRSSWTHGAKKLECASPTVPFLPDRQR